VLSRSENSNQSSKRASIPRWLAIIVALVFWLIGVPLFYCVAPWAISLFLPRCGWAANHPGPWNLIGLIPVGIATICLIWLMVLHIAQAPERVALALTPSYLIRRGPYAFSRHPMYLSELALLAGWTIFYGSVAVLIPFVTAGAFFNFVHIPREEHTLEARFGEAYREYKNQAPRWFWKIQR